MWLSEQRFHFLPKGENLIIPRIPQISCNGFNVSCVPLSMQENYIQGRGRKAAKKSSSTNGQGGGKRRATK